jgi:N4-gp56 family major capsid protein
MVMATDELVRKATTTTTQLQKLIPQIWAARIEKNLRKRAVFEQSVIVNTDLLVPGSGDTVYIPILADLGAAVALTEGTDMVITTLSTAASVPIVPTEYGVTVEVTRKALDRIKYDGMAEVMDRLSYAMSQAIEGALAGLYNQTVPSVGGGLSNVYANGKTSANITTADTFNDQLILNGIAQLQIANNIPFEDGYWRLYMSPTQWAALLQDTNTRQDLRWAAPERLLTGEVGALHGCRLIVTNYIQTDVENTVNVQNAMLLAPRWAFIAYKRRPEVVVDPTLYDMGRRRRFGVVADFQTVLVHAERAQVLKSA